MTFLDKRGGRIDVAKFEVDEQLLTSKYVPKNAHVLELGARYGTVSYVINSNLDDPTKHVAVEPDVSVVAALIHNKLVNRSKYNIVVGAVSRKPLQFNILAFDELGGYGNFTTPTENISHVETFTVEELEKRYDVSFNCLVADCEGFLEQFLDENPDFPNKLDTVIFESDSPERCNYEKVKEILAQAGLHPVVDGFQSVWIR
jgi:FkbM family methyltransferase